MRYHEEGPQGFCGGLIMILTGTATLFIFFIIGNGFLKAARYIFNEPEPCINCSVEDIFLENLCVDCLNEGYDYDVYCVICEDTFILNTPHYFKSYCDDCAKIDYYEYFCSSCGAYTDTPQSLANNKCA